MRKRMSIVAAVVMVALAGCSSGAETTTTTTTAPSTSVPTSPVAPASSDPSPAPTLQDVMELEDFAPLDRGTYFIDPDGDPSTLLGVVYEVPFEGWSQWPGAVKFADDGGHVAVSITTVDNVVRQACHNHSPTDPPVGPTVDDLATALTDLAPFKVTSPPKNVHKVLHALDDSGTFLGLGVRGKYMELTVPDLPVSHEGFTECLDANLYSWMSPHLGPPGDNAFFGYTGPGYREKIWILDFSGTRLMIAAGTSPGSSSEDLAEQQAILDSIWN